MPITPIFKHNVSNMGYYLGLDIGSVNVKLCLVDEEGRVVKRDTEKIASDARSAASALLGRLEQIDSVIGASASGSGKGIIPEEWGWGEHSSPLAVASGVLRDHPDARTIIQIGGQSSLVISLEDGLDKPWKVTSNPLCAAGTGRFLEQQAYRLGITMDELARTALAHEGPVPRIAARCSVFAKSDLIHLQQKGVSLSAMLYALCESIARMIISLKKEPFETPIYLVGGVAANGAVLRALNNLLTTKIGRPVSVAVPQDCLHTEALGAALLSRGHRSEVKPIPAVQQQQRYFETEPLVRHATPAPAELQPVAGACRGYLGIDVGSTSTKAVILDEVSNTIIAKTYLMTAGRPVEAIKQVMANLLQKGAGNVDIAGVGVTGSGRYLIGGFVGADMIKNEITAQTRAAAELDPEADIIEIGGQDSKLVLKRNGVVIDCQMNKACAAGTGSFIDELADMLGVKVINGDFARLAFTAPHTIDLGTRCAAFMSQSITSAQQDGVSLPVITASLANAIAKNYLSKVVAHRKLGQRIILTGAVFYNEAVVAAFRQQLPRHHLMVAEHREVSGAMGAALLARDTSKGDEKSVFKGFQALVESECKLTAFPCYHCGNTCTITQMKLPSGALSFYGSRCDRYDAQTGQARMTTAFDEREKLLFQDYDENSGTGPMVGIPRALLVHDLAPQLIGFLRALDARIRLSPKTTTKIIEQSIELAYTDSCFPVKLLHGHVAALKDKTDFILFPSAIRLGIKEGDENQKYACPLVQASPYIVREVLGLAGKLLSPVLDLSLGNAEVIDNLTKTGITLGASPKKARQAALAGVAAQARFEMARAELGARVLADLKVSGKQGVVLLTRSYMSGDTGANLGIAEKLAQLGVVPIPIDFLPLESIDVSAYSDRPYWSYEGKFIAASVLIARDPNLYGLMLTNFGCGPNSFILPILEDIMGCKPMGQLELDEHAAEAGIVTRLEAFVDTIKGYAGETQQEVQPAGIRRRTIPLDRTTKTMLIPYMAPFLKVLSGVIEASGVKVQVLPETDERSLDYANQLTAGTECLPYRLTLGDFLRFCHDHGDEVPNSEFMMASAYGPCRFGKYALEQGVKLKQAGFDIPVRSTTSNKAYHDMNLGGDFPRRAVSGIFAADSLEKLLWRNRPYEKETGAADALFDHYLQRFIEGARRKEDLTAILRRAAHEFESIIDPALPRKPLVGINGEIYLRANRFANNDLVRNCEAVGLEVSVSPMGEWFEYIFYRSHEDNIRFRRFHKLLQSYFRYRFVAGENKRHFNAIDSGADGFHAESIEDILAKSEKYLSPRCGSEAVVSLGAGINWLENESFAGVISVMPHGCMPGGIVAAMADNFGTLFQKPWISLTYDGILESNNRTRIN
ncbi:acyl-CoA dehydratase activase, partial [Dehalogenimonas sp. THU2]|uniref:acyl-CoA dehydratase activase n=1 Tax=Dehalogenimonas sp. THU2 TaxID=3151121 RepID=UPI003218232A